MSEPLVGHLDPAFLALMDETKVLLRKVFCTTNELTIPISATGSAGMEACLVNLLEPGDEAIVAINGVFGTRMADIVERAGASVVRIERPWGEPILPDDIRDALRRPRKPKLVALVHAETSTGARSPVDQIGPIVREADSLFVVDAVTSLGGCPLEIDTWQIDACYSGTQKCLSCPPGLSPVTFGPRARAALETRSSKVQSWYLDLTMIAKYWGAERVYHHTAPISMSYALAEALKLVDEEGLEARFRRHERNHYALAAGLEALGFRYLVEPEFRLWMLNSVYLPEGVEEAPLRRRLLDDYGIEVGGGLGAFAGKIWRIGLMGESSQRASVIGLLAALEEILPNADSGQGVAAAQAVTRQESA